MKKTCFKHSLVSHLQEIYKDRKKFSKQVFEVASSDLVNMGITVVSYTLKDIRDEEVIRTKKNYTYNRSKVVIPLSLLVSGLPEGTGYGSDGRGEA